MITQAEFTNYSRSLANIEGWQVEGLFGMAQQRFEYDPLDFFLHTDTTTQEAIWRAMENGLTRFKLGEIAR